MRTFFLDVKYRSKPAIRRRPVTDCNGSGPASRFGNLTAGLLSFELDCQAADFRENPGSAIYSRSRLAAPRSSIYRLWPAATGPFVDKIVTLPTSTSPEAAVCREFRYRASPVLPWSHEFTKRTWSLAASTRRGPPNSSLTCAAKQRAPSSIGWAAACAKAGPSKAARAARAAEDGAGEGPCAVLLQHSRQKPGLTRAAWFTLRARRHGCRRYVPL